MRKEKFMDNKLYNKDSIESLSPLEFTRLKPGVYAGDTTYSTQLLVEIVSNAVDEFRLGHGKAIDILINNEDNNTNIIVHDYGQGFLVNEMREDGKSVLEAAFSVLNTSGKYRSDGTYEGTSLGSFGIGSKITTFLSHKLKVTTNRDGKSETVYFKEGVFEKRETGAIDSGISGTTVEWTPSEEFFTHTSVEENKIKSLLNTISCLCPGLHINCNINGEQFNYYSEHGLNDLVDEAVKGKEIITNRFNMQYNEGKEKLDMVLTYTSNYSLTLIPYVNTGLTEKGPHITQIKTIITKEFNKFFRDKKWLKDKDENLTGDDIQEGMYIVFNMTAPNVAYDAQVKSTVTKLDMSNFASIIAVNLQYWLTSNEKEIKTIFDKAAAARKAREAAKNARERVRETNKKKEKVLKFDSKLADCFSKDRSKCEIYITEGDSASGNLKTARDNEFQAVMPVRGKILNTQKATLDKIQKNAEIMTMIDAFGLTIDTKSMKVTYEPEDLRYGKIIIMSDADVDGAHIKNLFYTFIWNFCPQLIIDGYVYAGVPPLYKITIGKEYKYIKNDEELEKFKAANPGKKFQVNRMKGLGEMSVEETEQTLTDPNERILKQITVEDVEAANVLFDQLMGTGIIARKEFIKLHSKEAMYNQE
jgi:DNA gyrase/topoisomerase IV subunit B